MPKSKVKINRYYFGICTLLPPAECKLRIQLKVKRNNTVAGNFVICNFAFGGSSGCPYREKVSITGTIFTDKSFTPIG